MVADKGRSMRTLIGAIGYRNLRDHSAAFEVVDRLAAAGAEADVTIEDTSYNPIALVQWFQGLASDEQFDRVILVAAVPRAGRAGGALTPYRWDGRLPPDDLVQQAVTEAVTGIINLDNTLTIAGYFKALPEDVVVVEIEPVDHAFGPEFSVPVTRAIAEASTMVRHLVTDAGAILALPRRGLELLSRLQARES